MKQTRGEYPAADATGVVIFVAEPRGGKVDTHTFIGTGGVSGSAYAEVDLRQLQEIFLMVAREVKRLQEAAGLRSAGDEELPPKMPGHEQWMDDLS